MRLQLDNRIEPLPWLYIQGIEESRLLSLDEPSLTGNHESSGGINQIQVIFEIKRQVLNGVLMLSLNEGD